MNTRYEVTYRNLTLEGHSILRVEKIVSLYEVSINQRRDGSKKLVRKLIEQNVKPMTFPLKEVTAQQVAMCRKKGIASFVFKEYGKLYWTKIPKNINFVSSALLGTHKCAAAGDVCLHATAASDKEGGCAKVRNGSCYIERYEWIPVGYETFNTYNDSFVVGGCFRYEDCPEKPPRPIEEVRALKFSLAQFALEDDAFYPDGTVRKKRAYTSDVNRF